MKRRELARRIGPLCGLFALAGCETLSDWIGLQPASNEPPPPAVSRTPPPVDAPAAAPPADSAPVVAPPAVAASPPPTDPVAAAPLRPAAPSARPRVETPGDPLRPIERTYTFGALVPPSARPRLAPTDALGPVALTPAA
ncbi:MAG: hypothetical protein AAF684_06595, partial [Pseudomonadota bacterium]